MRFIKNGCEVKDSFKSLYGNVLLKQIKRYDSLIRWFKKSFGAEGCHICSSSGRVEIIGNHTDHNGGAVVGCTVNLDIAAAFLPSEDRTVTIKSKGYKDIKFGLDEIDEVEIGSRGMAKGVLKGLVDRGYNIGGFKACMTSNIASGAGISSSAAFELLIGEIENALYNGDNISPVELAKIGQYSENVYFNKPCGLLDQGVIAVGGIVWINFKNGFEYVNYSNELSSLSLVLVDTGGSHANLTEHYAAIPTEMKAVASFFNQKRLADVSAQEFFAHSDEIAEKLGQRFMLRAKHFYEENERVEQMRSCLASNDTAQFTQLVDASGQSSLHQLQNCAYEGGDTLIPDALKLAKELCPSCAVRVHGGGFAGTVLCVVPKKETKRFAEKMSEHYGKEKVHVLNVRSVGTCVL